MALEVINAKGKKKKRKPYRKCEISIFYNFSGP